MAHAKRSTPAAAAAASPRHTPDIRRRAEVMRLRLVAESCESAIAALLDDTGPLYALPSEIRTAIRGDLDSAVRTLDAARDRAEEKADELDAKATGEGA